MSETVQVGFKKLHEQAQVPSYQTDQAAGADLHACLESPVEIPVGERAIVPTGIAIGLPIGFEAQVRPRSGLAAKHGVTVLNTPGTIDSDYRGELQVILINLGAEPFVVQHGERVAQLVIARHDTVLFSEADDLGQTVRGENKFGSTGK